MFAQNGAFCHMCTQHDWPLEAPPRSFALTCSLRLLGQQEGAHLALLHEAALDAGAPVSVDLAQLVPVN
jgi:hypothetical protein